MTQQSKLKQLRDKLLWKRKAAHRIEAQLAALTQKQAAMDAQLTEMRKAITSDLALYTKRQGQLEGSLNFYNKRLSMLTQNLELMRGDYTTLNEIFRIPTEQPFPAPTTDYTLAGQTLETLLRDYPFTSVLDIGCGGGQHTRAFIDAGKDVYVNDIYESDFIRENAGKLHAYFGDFNTYEFDRQFDCIWASHVLEHQLNPHNFLCKVQATLKEDGVLAITVPPPRGLMAGGHVSLWNPGLLLYHLVLAGFDCREARVMRYGYNQSVIVRKRSINVMDKLKYDSPDIAVIKPYLPDTIPYLRTALGETFNGDMAWLNDASPVNEETI